MSAWASSASEELAMVDAAGNLSRPESTESVPIRCEHNMLAAALAHAAQGLAIFPLHNPLPDGSCSCGKKDCGKSTGKHPRTVKGLKAATTNELQLRRWFRDWPEANIGLPCGEENGVIVLDVDGVKGDQSLERLVDLNGPLPVTRKVVTGKGFHLYFKHPGGKVRNVAQIDAAYPGLDSRADGGYVVAPPSLHLSGMRYQVDPQSPDQIAAAPAWLIEFINRRAPKAAGAATASGDSLGEGSRNSSLACWRRLNSDPPCRLNIDPGPVATFCLCNCG